MTPALTKTIAEAVERLRLLADACGVPGLDHLPVVSRANALAFAADIHALLAALKAKDEPASTIADEAELIAVIGKAVREWSIRTGPTGEEYIARALLAANAIRFGGK